MSMHATHAQNERMEHAMHTGNSGDGQSNGFDPTPPLPSLSIT